MVGLNPNGHDWAMMYNLDAYGIGYIVFTVIYSLILFAGCGIVWLQRNHPVIRMRKISLAILSLLTLHVYLVIILLLYPNNGHWPCSAEYWIMSIYLPVGIGLFQAQNQQLLLVSRGQNQLMLGDEMYKPLAPKDGLAKRCMFHLRRWWESLGKQGKYEAFVVVGIIFQFVMSLIIYCVSRKFNSGGITSMDQGPALCRRGWEWFPSILWQFVWFYFMGPLLLWEIRMVRDIYHWRLQTILSVAAGIPATPLWVIALFSNGFAAVNKYWVPAMWFAPGLITMQIVTLAFPMYHVYKHKQAARETTNALVDWEKRGGNSSAESSIITKRSGGRMYSMTSLEECLAKNHSPLHIYCALKEFCGENIAFLVKVMEFRKKWAQLLADPSISHDKMRIRNRMYRHALTIYIAFVHTDTSNMPINIESPIYNQLTRLFGAATILVASQRPSTPSSVNAFSATPWEDTLEDLPRSDPDSYFDHQHHSGTIQMHSLKGQRSFDHTSATHIVELDPPTDIDDPLRDFIIPHEFDESCFEAAKKSIQYMVWSETWQRYNEWNRRNSASA